MSFKMGLGAKAFERLLVIVAMDVEEEAAVRSLGAYDAVVMSERFGIQAKVFRKDGKELILVNSGIGIVNAGVTTALIAEKHRLDGVLLLGVAGALRPEIGIGHLIVATSVLQHDSLFSGDTGTQLMAPGLPLVSVPPSQHESPLFETDLVFREWIRASLPSLPSIQSSEGIMLSGCEFVGTHARKTKLAGLAEGAVAVEMEAAGIALVVKKLGLPFAVLKTIADRLNPDESISSDYNHFTKEAAANAGAVLQVLWGSW